MSKVTLKKESLYKEKKYGTRVAIYLGEENGKVSLDVNGLDIKVPSKTFNQDWKLLYKD